MKYLENFNSYDAPEGKEPITDTVNKWKEFLKERYPISDYRNMKTIQIEDRLKFLSGNFLTKKRLTDQIFYDIKTDQEMQESEIHEPSLRKAIKEWIDSHSKLNESLESFDVDFAIAKIQEHFEFQEVKEMLDKEVLEWDESGSSYYQLSNGEAEDAIISHLIDWYSSKFPSGYSDINQEILKETIQKTYNFLNY